MKSKKVTISNGLKWILLVNTFSTGGFALILLLFGNFVGQLTGIENGLIIRFVGFGLLVFVSFTFWAAKQKQIPANMLLTFAAIDLIWVIDSAILISLLPLTVVGIIGIILVALLVAIFSIFEFYFYKVNQI
ncbi:hypothetical protein SAMN05444392_1197 [Seinonella peptonophila]|uniref:Uncharacterized protein n=1 Tax=Seinonella peptonophila TaxID=112248 RepID=A0A1M5B771_9BACL|nr:hypothetical protein [Seinonella peptonophila]SHF38270.1 hypothetical protein SAMN05444392_1197 [Seinonella peptonophila]